MAIRERNKRQDRHKMSCEAEKKGKRVRHKIHWQQQQQRQAKQRSSSLAAILLLIIMMINPINSNHFNIIIKTKC
jgi:hypothetical protein